MDGVACRGKNGDEELEAVMGSELKEKRGGRMRGKKLDVVPLLRRSDNDVRPSAGLLAELDAAAAGEWSHPQAGDDLLRQAAVLVEPG